MTTFGSMLAPRDITAPVGKIEPRQARAAYTKAIRHSGTQKGSRGDTRTKYRATEWTWPVLKGSISGAPAAAAKTGAQGQEGHGGAQRGEPGHKMEKRAHQQVINEVCLVSFAPMASSLSTESAVRVTPPSMPSPRSCQSAHRLNVNSSRRCGNCSHLRTMAADWMLHRCKQISSVCRGRSQTFNKPSRRQGSSFVCLGTRTSWIDLTGPESAVWLCRKQRSTKRQRV